MRFRETGGAQAALDQVAWVRRDARRLLARVGLRGDVQGDESREIFPDGGIVGAEFFLFSILLDEPAIDEQFRIIGANGKLESQVNKVGGGRALVFACGAHKVLEERLQAHRFGAIFEEIIIAKGSKG